MRRMLRGVFLGGAVALALSLVSRETLMPLVAPKLENPMGDIRGTERVLAHGAYEPNDVLVKGKTADRSTLTVQGFSCTLPVRLAGSLLHITATEARYVPPNGAKLSGGWLMTGTKPHELPNWEEPVLEVIDTGKFFLHTKRVDFDRIVRTRNWHQTASTLGLMNELKKAKSARFSAFAVQLHQRLTAPLLTIIMVYMGLAVILKDQNRNIFISAGWCLVVVAVFYALSYFCRYLGDNEYIAPPLAAWLPVFILGPVAFARFDAIHT